MQGENSRTGMTTLRYKIDKSEAEDLCRAVKKKRVG